MQPRPSSQDAPDPGRADVRAVVGAVGGNVLRRRQEGRDHPQLRRRDPRRL